MEIDPAHWTASFVDYESLDDKLSEALNAIARVAEGDAKRRRLAKDRFLTEFETQVKTVDQFYHHYVNHAVGEFLVVDRTMAVVDSLNFLYNKLQKLLGFVRFNLLAFNRILKRVHANMDRDVYQRTYQLQTLASFYGSDKLVSLHYRVYCKLAHLQSKLLDAADFHCTLCSNMVTEPIALSCGHFFCQTCLVAFFRRKKNKECPNGECGRPQIIDPSSPRCRPNESIKSMLELVRRREAERQLAVAKGTPLRMPNLVAGPASSASSSANFGINGMTSLTGTGTGGNGGAGGGGGTAATNLPVTTPVVLGRGGSTYHRTMGTAPAMTGLETLQQQNQMPLSLGPSPGAGGGALQQQNFLTLDQSTVPDLTLTLTSPDEVSGPPLLLHSGTAGSGVGDNNGSDTHSGSGRSPLKATSSNGVAGSGTGGGSMYVSMEDCVQPPLLKSLSPPQPSRADSRTDRPPQTQRFDSTGLPYHHKAMDSLGLPVPPPRGFPGKPRRQRSNSEERTSPSPFRGHSPPPAFGPRQRSRSDPSIEFHRSFSTNMNVRMDSRMDSEFETIFNLRASSIMDPPPPPGASAYSDEPHTLHELEMFPPAQAPTSSYPMTLVTSDSAGSGSGSGVSNTKNFLSPSMYTTPINSRLSPRSKKTTPPSSTSSRSSASSKSNDAAAAAKQTQVVVNAAPFNPPSTISSSNAAAAAAAASSSSSGGGPPLLQHSRTQLDEDMPTSSGESMEIPLLLDDPPGFSAASNSSTSAAAAAVSSGDTTMLTSGSLLLDGTLNLSSGNLTLDNQTPPLLHRSASSIRRRAHSLPSVPTDPSFLNAFAAPSVYQLQNAAGMRMLGGGGSGGLIQSNDHLGSGGNFPPGSGHLGGGGMNALPPPHNPQLVSRASCPVPSPHQQERALMLSPSQAPAPPLTLDTTSHSHSLPTGFAHHNAQLVQTPSHQLRNQLQNLSLQASQSEPFIGGGASTAAGANAAASTAPLTLDGTVSASTSSVGAFPHLGTDFTSSSVSSFSSDPTHDTIPKAMRVACSHCHKSKTACDGHRPCARCVRMHRGDTCVDRVPKKRGRPHKMRNSAHHIDDGSGESSSSSHLGGGGEAGNTNGDLVLNDLQLDDPLSSLSSSSAAAAPTLSSAPTVNLSVGNGGGNDAAVGQSHHHIEVDLRAYSAAANGGTGVHAAHELSSLPAILPSYGSGNMAAHTANGGTGVLDFGTTGGFFSVPTNGMNAYSNDAMFSFSAASTATGAGGAVGGFDPLIDPLAASTDLPPIA